MSESFMAFAALAAIVMLAWRAGFLSGSGAAMAALVGAAILVGTGWRGAVVLVVFFVTSSLLSRFITPRRAPVGDAKGNQRDGWQVLANGGAAAAGALGDMLLPGAGIWILTAALAAAAADTWATTLGGLSQSAPRLLLSRRVVPPGTNGGVTPTGTLGAVAGALAVATCGALVAGSPAVLVAAGSIGVAGMFLDSLLGERWQGRFECPSCAQPSERRRHRCGTPTIATGGMAWLTNDGVNALATTAAGAAGLAAWWWWA